MGIVSQRQADLAADVARQVAGYKKLLKFLGMISSVGSK